MSHSLGGSLSPPSVPRPPEELRSPQGFFVSSSDARQSFQAPRDSPLVIQLLGEREVFFELDFGPLWLTTQEASPTQVVECSWEHAHKPPSPLPGQLHRFLCKLCCSLVVALEQ